MINGVSGCAQFPLAEQVCVRIAVDQLKSFCDNVANRKIAFFAAEEKEEIEKKEEIEEKFVFMSRLIHKFKLLKKNVL